MILFMIFNTKALPASSFFFSFLCEGYACLLLSCLTAAGHEYEASFLFFLTLFFPLVSCLTACRTKKKNTSLLLRKLRCYFTLLKCIFPRLFLSLLTAGCRNRSIRELIRELIRRRRSRSRKKKRIPFRPLPPPPTHPYRRQYGGGGGMGL